MVTGTCCKHRRGRFDPMLRKCLSEWKLEQLPLLCRKRRSGGWASRGSGPGRRRSRNSRKHQLAGAFPPDLPKLPGAGRWRVGKQHPHRCAHQSGLQLCDRRERYGHDQRQFGDNQPARHTHGWHENSLNTANISTPSRQVQNYNRNAIGVQPAEVMIEPDVIGFDLSEIHAMRRNWPRSVNRPRLARSRTSNNCWPDSIRSFSGSTRDELNGPRTGMVDAQTASRTMTLAVFLISGL